MGSRYTDLSREELIRLLEARDRDTNRLGLVWERNEIERDKSLNSDFVALELVPDLCVGIAPWHNLLIEGDNFDALRHLRMTLAGRVKCILIDPPYNTGNRDFIYNDRFLAKEDAWRHSTWLEFMYRRLTLARDLLREDGVIFVHIGEEEVDRLGCLMDQVLPGMKVGKLVWKTRTGSNAETDFLYTHDHEYVLCYARPGFLFGGIKKDSSNYTNPNNDPRGPWAPDNLTLGFNHKQRPNLFYPLRNPSNGTWYACNPKRVWVYASEKNLKPGQKVRTKTMEQFIAEDKVIFPENDRVVTFASVVQLRKAIEEGTAPPNIRANLYDDETKNEEFLWSWVGKPIGFGSPNFKRHLRDLLRDVRPLSSWIRNSSDETAEENAQLKGTGGNSLVAAMTKEGTKELQQMLPDDVFGYPKPRSLMQGLIAQATTGDDIILDFFAGSGTTGHAVLGQNAEDGSNRRFILVSSTEATADEPNKNVCRDIAQKRLCKAIEGYSFPTKKGLKEVAGLEGDCAYLRCQRLPVEQMTELNHAQVWLALQLMHLETLAPWPDAPFASAGGEEGSLIYVARFRREDLGALRQLLSGCTSTLVYSWQPEVLRHHLRGPQVELRAVPKTLAERYGVRL